MSRDWDESEHPRHPRHAPGGRGGEFRDRIGGWIQTVGRVTRRGWSNDEHGRTDLQRLITGPGTGVETSELAGGETAFTFRLDFPDGRSIVSKRFAPVWELEPEDDDDYDEDGLSRGPDQNWDEEQVDAARAEYKAARIAEAIGAPAPPVIYDTAFPTAVYMGFVDGRWPGYKSETREAALETDEAVLIGVLDLLIFNEDRGAGNWLITPGGSPVAIDHGESFKGLEMLLGEDGEIGYAPGGDFARRLVSFESWPSNRLEWQPNRLHPYDVHIMKARLADLQAEGVITSGELRYMLRVLDGLASAATGDRRLIS